MYSPFFGLKQKPFSIAPDPRYLFMSERHREALAHLLYGVQGGGGFVLLTGEIGAGKTTVCRCFLEQIPPRCNVAYIFNPKLSALELLITVCHEFGIKFPPLTASGTPPTLKDYVDGLNEYLLRTHAVGQNNVLIIDEAQNLAPDVLEQLRLLTNLETSERKLLQIVLIGQPELRGMLARPELEQLAQRVIARYHLDSLSGRETVAYIAHRLAVAGLEGAMPFEHKALQRIHELTRGVPRRINLLCDRALLGAYATGQRQAGVAIVEKAAAEVFGKAGPAEAAARRAHARAAASGAPVRGGVSPWVVGGSALAGVALLAAAQWAWSWHRQAGPGAGGGLAAVTGSAAAARATGGGGALAGRGMPGAQDGGLSSARGAGSAAAVAGMSLALPPAARAAAASGGVASVAGDASAPAAAFPELPVASAPLTGPVDLATAFGTPWRDDRAAWRELALAWGVTLRRDAGDPCAAAARAELACFRDRNTLALVRALDRPVIVTLRDAGDVPVYALLVGLGADTATLQAGGVRQVVPLSTLAAMWRGDFATLWRLPAAYAGPPADGARGAAVDRLAAALAAARHEAAPPAGQAMDAALRGRLYAFQMTQGLRPDGVAGPATFMQLNRAAGVDEPRLGASPGTAPAPVLAGR